MCGEIADLPRFGTAPLESGPDFDGASLSKTTVSHLAVSPLISLRRGDFGVYVHLGELGGPIPQLVH